MAYRPETAPDQVPPPSFQDKLRADAYDCKLPYGNRDSPERAAYGAEKDRLFEQFRIDLIRDADLDPDSKAANVAFSKAWDHGHSGGYAEVAYCFDDFAACVKAAFMEKDADYSAAGCL